jgi:UDP-N-acetylmuramyl pentapeptide synthase
MNAVFTVGDEAALISDAAAGVPVRRNFDTQAACAEFLRTWLRDGDAVLLKGSRSAGMEQVLTHLETA